MASSPLPRSEASLHPADISFSTQQLSTIIPYEWGTNRPYEWGAVRSHEWGTVRPYEWGAIRPYEWGVIRPYEWGAIRPYEWGAVRSHGWGAVRSHGWGTNSSNREWYSKLYVMPLYIAGVQKRRAVPIFSKNTSQARSSREHTRQTWVSWRVACSFQGR